MLDQNKTPQELLEQNVISNLLVGDQEYDINSKYWGRYEPSDVKTINGESIFEDGGGDIISPIISGESENSAVLRGGNNVAGNFATALGELTTASGYGSVAEGYSTEATESMAHAEGYYTDAKGKYSHAEGAETSASGISSHAEGNNTEASGNYSHSEGYKTQAIGSQSHAEGYQTKATAEYGSHAEGNSTEASGNYSHAEGYKTTTLGRFSHAEGVGTITNNEGEHASGKYNISNSDTQFSIGIGTSKSVRKNAFEVKQNGDVYVNSIGGYDGENSQTEGIKSLQEVVTNTVDLNTEQTITAAKIFSAGINLKNTRIRKVGSPVNTDDAANKQYVDDATGNIVNIEGDVEALQYNVDEIYGRLEQYQLGIAYDDYQSFLNAARYIIDDWPVGQNIYIRQLDVPDIWVSKVFRNVDNTREYTYTTDEQFIQDVRNGVQIWHHQFSLLETAKVDLSDTATKTEVNALKKTVGTKADVVELNNYLTEGAALPYPAVYRRALNVPHMVSFRRYEEGVDTWYLAFCGTHIIQGESVLGQEYIFYKRDTDNQYKFVKIVDRSTPNDEWYKLGATVFNEDLRENKQDKLTDEQIANINAVPNKADIVDIASINKENGLKRFPYPAIYTYYRATLPHTAQFSLRENGVDKTYVVICIRHDSQGNPTEFKYALFERTNSTPAYIEFLRYVTKGDEFFTICQKQFHDDLPSKVTELEAKNTALETRIAELENIISQIKQ